MMKNAFLLIGIGVAWLGLCRQTHAELINHWKFDETSGATASDSAGSLNLALQGDSHFAADATRGQVLALDGASDYASNTGEPFTSDGTFTVGLWVNHSDTGNLTQKWMSWGIAGARFFLGPWSGNSNGCVFGGFGSVNASFNASGAKPLAGDWQYWTLVGDGDRAVLYRDGELLQILTIATSGSISSSGEFRIGRQYGSNEEYLNGLLDDVAIWNEALTPHQIKTAMTLGAENYMVPEPSSAALLLTAVLGGGGVCRWQRPQARRNRSWTRGWTT